MRLCGAAAGSLAGWLAKAKKKKKFDGVVRGALLFLEVG